MGVGAFRILVPLDGSPDAESVLAALMPWVRRRSSEIELLRIVELEAEVPGAQAYLAKAAKALELHEIPNSTRVGRGPTADLILRVAKQDAVYGIALSTHGRGGVRRGRIGRVAAEVLRRSPIPVFVTRPGSISGEWKEIVVALDGSIAAEAILGETVDLAEAVGAGLRLVRVSLPLLALGEYRGVPAQPLEREEDVERYLQAVSERVVAQGVPARPMARVGQAAREIARAAREVGAGLICMTTEGRSGLGRVVSGSVAEEVILNAPCPVLVRRLTYVPASLEPEMSEASDSPSGHP